VPVRAYKKGLGSPRGHRLALKAWSGSGAPPPPSSVVHNLPDACVPIKSELAAAL